MDDPNVSTCGTQLHQVVSVVLLGALVNLTVLDLEYGHLAKSENLGRSRDGNDEISSIAVRLASYHHCCDVHHRIQPAASWIRYT